MSASRIAPLPIGHLPQPLDRWLLTRRYLPQYGRPKSLWRRRADLAWRPKRPVATGARRRQPRERIRRIPWLYPPASRPTLKPGAIRPLRRLADIGGVRFYAGEGGSA